MNESLSHRLAAHHRFEWRDGMRGLDLDESWPGPFRVLVDEADTPLYARDGWRLTVKWDELDSDYQAGSNGLYLPDLDDDATQGVLLAMLVEAVDGYVRVEQGIRAAGLRQTEVYFHSGADNSSRCAAPTYGEALGLALLDVWAQGS